MISNKKLSHTVHTPVLTIKPTDHSSSERHWPTTIFCITSSISTPAHHLTSTSQPRPPPQSAPHSISPCEAPDLPSGLRSPPSPYFQTLNSPLGVPSSAQLCPAAHQPAPASTARALAASLASSLAPDACDAPVFLPSRQDLERALLSFHPYV